MHSLTSSVYPEVTAKGSQMKHIITSDKITSLGLNPVENIWDYVNKVSQVVF